MVYRTLLVACAGALIACANEKAGSEGQVDTPSVAAKLASASQPTSVASRWTCGDEYIGDEGIGKVSIGTPLDSVRAHCKIIRDTIVPGGEGTMARKVTVSLPSDTVVAEIVNNRVWRVEVASPRFHTRDSLGVGTSIGRLLALEDPRGANGEGQFFVLSPDHCGLSFRLSEGWDQERIRHPIDRAKLSTVPRTTTVRTVLITGCPNN